MSDILPQTNEELRYFILAVGLWVIFIGTVVAFLWPKRCNKGDQ